MAVIQARGLGKAYKGKTAVNNLSFDVRPGTVTGFLGPNGSGKSTTMRLMLGLDNGHGTCTFDGHPFASYDVPMQHVGALLEAKPFHPTRTARNHLRMIAAPNSIPDTRVDEVLGMVGLADVANKEPGTFSLGMGQRLGLAAALLGNPHTLILDEPANGLDPQGIRWMRDLLKSLASEGRSVFVSSHLLSEMALMADELVVIGRGRMIANGPVEDFTRQSSANHIKVRTPQAHDLAALIGQRLAGQGSVKAVTPGELSVVGLTADDIGDMAFDNQIRLHELSTIQASLEDAFLELTGGSEEYQAQNPVHHRPQGPAFGGPQSGPPQGSYGQPPQGQYGQQPPYAGQPGQQPPYAGQQQQPPTYGQPGQQPGQWAQPPQQTPPPQQAPRDGGDDQSGDRA
ncbi:ABC transporter ATP-binding protein [Nocardioides sp. Root151]|uniref:ABC transporter ATP-binding protein n=1 Tax=Nocardioides sp. Root151 TaxID=1736475 RepID=UPI0009E8B2F6|nr:ATP-binding cassette domain-containing protein [Nocardioides sp. Root151]